MAENHHPDRNGPAARWRRLLPPLALALLLTLMFWKLILTDEYTWLESPDLTYQVLPWFQFQAAEWHQGRFPLWDPYHWAGQPLIGQAQPGAAYPLNWVLFLLPLHHGWIRQVYLHWYFVLLHVLAALFAYALCRDLGRSRRASMLGGVAFALTGYVGSVDWPQMLNGAIWAPLVFLFVFRAMRGARPVASAALGGLFLGVAWLSGHHQIPIFTTLFAGGLWLYQIFRTGRPDWKMARCAAVFLLLAGLTSGLQTLPAYEYGKLARRWVGVDEPVGWNQKVPYLVHGQYSFTPSSILGAVIPNLARTGEPFSGVVLLTLALFGLAEWRGNRQVAALGAIALAGWLVALGSYDFLHGILYALVPMIEKARSPYTALHLYSFAVAVLAAYGLDGLLGDRNLEFLRGAVRVLVAVAAGIAAFGLVLAYLQKLGDDRMMITAFAAGGLALVLAMWRRGSIGAWGAALAAGFLVLLELGNFTGYAWADKYDKNRGVYLRLIPAHADLAAWLARRPEPVRITVDDKEIPYNFGDMYGIPVQGGYLASLTENLMRHELGGDRIWNLFGVNYSVAKEAARAGQELVYESQSGLKVYRNPGAYPRAFAVHRVTQAAEEWRVKATMADPGFDPRTQALVPDAPPPMGACQGGDDVRLSLYRADRVGIAARMQCAGLVVLSDIWYPGWTATVDGRTARIHETDGMLRGIAVDAGEHRIEMTYRPWPVRLGAVMSALGLIAGIAACWMKM